MEKRTEKESRKQLNIRIDLDNPAESAFFYRLQNRDKEKYPKIIDYLIDAASILEIYNAGEANEPMLTTADLDNIRTLIMQSLRDHDREQRNRIAP